MYNFEHRVDKARMKNNKKYCFYLPQEDVREADKRTLSTNSGKEIPAAFAAIGERLVAVMPGQAFISKKRGLPSFGTIKSVYQRSFGFEVFLNLKVHVCRISGLLQMLRK